MLPAPYARADPLNVRFYEEHQYATTVARLSPNGEWVASGDVSGRVRVWGLNDDLTLKVSFLGVKKKSIDSTNNSSQNVRTRTGYSMIKQ